MKLLESETLDTEIVLEQIERERELDLMSEKTFDDYVDPEWEWERVRDEQRGLV